MKTINSKYKLLMLILILFLGWSCSGDTPEEMIEEEEDDPIVVVDEIVYDETGCLFTSYTNLVMAGYQGWFAAQGDDSNRGWYHYENPKCDGFKSDCSSIDMWPDMTEYETKYVTPYKYADGSSAYLYSPYDESSIDLHFKWMKENNIDGVHMQRFVVEVHSSNSRGKRHFNKVLESALKAAKKYGRAISIMYDLSGSDSNKVAYLEQDWNEIVEKYKLFDNFEHPTYLRHNGKPLMSIWGVGFNDSRKYTTADVSQLVNKLKGPKNKVAIMLGVPYYWRTFGNDTENNPAFHDLIKKVDIIMPWAVGRYNSPSSYNADIPYRDRLWTDANKIDYVPLVFPGFTWGNLTRDPNNFNSIPRLRGDFFWKQIAGAKLSGAKSLYVAMFDEVDEGTAIFKVKRNNEVPLVVGNEGYKFVGIENDLESDHYLWLTGQAANWFHGDNSYDITTPVRN
ncbi:glycoside hydrolase family 71/99-like protein [uncultured Polaribacter sp.]|uniref:glycoside hydrolase family 71/99-like protein n=1 Tax=uncultured Polaribacter sp. TaxID=174711 RepID=UPI00262CA003|nr:glycoside hydrolase family 71/99-like protein [uncultured Polaribacter sp.]